METLLLLLIFPLIWPVIARLIWSHTITWKEMLLQMAIVSVSVSAVYYAGTHYATSDFEYLNGKVTSKKKVTVSCDHSYDCNCSTTCSGTGTNRSCTETCQTCYDHDNDYDWRVHTSVGSYTVRRVDEQGAKTPPFWSKIAVGEPATLSNQYTNWIKAVPESLFNVAGHQFDQFATLIPPYPTLYAYHRVDRVIPVGLTVPNLPELNRRLAEHLTTIGPISQANINIVVVNTPDQSYRHALESAWVGGKKNDVTVIIGAPTYPVISWVDTMTLGGNAGNAMLAIQMRDRLMMLGEFGPKAVDTVATTVTEFFDRTPMAEFEYLKDQIEPPTWLMILTVSLAIGLSILLTWVFHTHDPFESRYARHRFFR